MPAYNALGLPETAGVAPSATPLVSGQPAHLPGCHWARTSCLCGCHYELHAKCDDKMCAGWRKQQSAAVLPSLEAIAW